MVSYALLARRQLIPFILLFSFGISTCSGQGKDPGSDTLIIDRKALRFIAFGDWGRNGEYKQKEVASELGIVAKQLKASFIASLGDNFYPSGVRSTMDHSWLASFEDIYTAHSLQNDWWVVLGNHDYKGNVQAEVDYTNIDRRWNMPARYFARKMRISEDSSQSVLLVFLDTTPWISQYYKSPDHADNVKSQDTAAQTKWLRQVLADTSRDIKWKLVFGHHPLFTGGPRLHSKETSDLNELLKPIFDKYRVDAYICGHEHSLQHIKPEGHTHYFISGAGSETTTAETIPGMTKFALSENGFIAFSVSNDKITVQVISYTGKILYTTIIKSAKS
jgi:hypothetical protein